MINSEKVFDRVEELQEYICNFPDSVLVPIFEKEIEYLQNI